MIIVICSTTKKVINNTGTNSMFPDGNIPGIEFKSNEQAIKIHDNSLLAQKISLAMPGYYELILDESCEVIDVTVTKTITEYQASLPPVTPEPTEIDYLLDLDYRLSMIELGL